MPIARAPRTRASDMAVRLWTRYNKPLTRPGRAQVDGDHDYSGVCGDLEAARTKVKPGGLMVLNDYYIFESIFLGGDPKTKKTGGRWGTYGVIHAANEFILRCAYTLFQPDPPWL